MIVHVLLPPYRQMQAGLRVPFLGVLARLSGQAPETGGVAARRGLFRGLVLTVCWICVVAALARPQRLDAPLHRDQPTRDLLLLVDLSASMDTSDFTNAEGETVDRVTASREVLEEFLATRKGDRVGVVVFGSAPFVLVPFTTDLVLVRRVMADMRAGMAGPRTAFGDAIGLGINLLADSRMKHKTIIALTDGNDTASQVPPGEAAAVAHDRGITIYAVAIGDPAAVGEDKLDEAALRDVAQVTGGEFFRAMDRAGLADIYRRLDAIETREVDTLSARPRTDLFAWPLAAMLLLSLGAQAIRLLPRARRRAQQAAE
ncbi:MAG: VWA domain-containing protein [Acetobacteraceae bacterium]|nr:VWA domain-containing protein [Acetobacteraceae bacterium]